MAPRPGVACGPTGGWRGGTVDGGQYPEDNREKRENSDKGDLTLLIASSNQRDCLLLYRMVLQHMLLEHKKGLCLLSGTCPCVKTVA